MCSDPLRFSQRSLWEKERIRKTGEDDSQFKSKKRCMVEIIINKILYSVLLIALIYKVPVYK